MICGTCGTSYTGNHLCNGPLVTTRGNVSVGNTLSIEDALKSLKVGDILIIPAGIYQETSK